MATDLFDTELRVLRRDRAARLGPELFLLERAFGDCLDRLATIRKEFARALLVGCPDPAWVHRLTSIVGSVDVVDPGQSFATAAGGRRIVEDDWSPAPHSYDLCIAVGTLDTVNDLPRALLTLRLALSAAGFLLGAVSGGDTLPQLRMAMRAADRLTGTATPHVHPRIEPSALAGLLTAAGFHMSVVDVDRVRVSYPTLDSLVADLRRMAGTNLLSQRSRRPLSSQARKAASAAFAGAGDGDKTVETFEIVHFAGWASEVKHA